MRYSAKKILLLISSLTLQLGMATHHHYAAENVTWETDEHLPNLLTADSLGIPLNETLRLLARDTTEAGPQLANQSSLLVQFVAYPLARLASHKINTIRSLLTLPFRVLMAPVDVARAIWRTKEAFQHPLNATLLDRVSEDLLKLRGPANR